MEKVKENITLILAVIGLLLFISFMFIHDNTVKKVKLIREDLYNDSIITNEHKDIKVIDSQIIIEQDRLQNIIESHEKRLRRLEKWKNNIDTNQ